MPLTIDERFLTVHPRTALWWIERETCRACRHHVSKDGQETCAPTGGTRGAYACITARDAGRACGPSARRFEAAEKAAA